MRDVIELAIGQEAERLNTVLRIPRDPGISPFPSHNSRGPAQSADPEVFGARDSSRRRFAVPTETPPHYVH